MILALLLGLAHGVSDAAAGLLIVQASTLDTQNALVMVLLYNGLAFGLQPIAGWILDRLGAAQRGAALGLVCTSLGLALGWFDLRLGLLFAGVGSSFFHAGGGGTAIRITPGKASAPGVFSAFGVLGLVIGAQLAFNFSLPTMGIMALILVTFAVILWLFKGNISTDTTEKTSSFPSLEMLALIIVLVAAVGLRSLVWTGLSAQVEGYTRAALWLALAAATGKLLGGFAADRLGWLRYALAALMVSLALLITSWGSWPENVTLVFLAGVLLLQSVTPLSLALIGRLMPRWPALAASLVLGTGLVAGGLPLMLFGAGWFKVIAVVMALILAAACYGICLVMFRKSGKPGDVIV
jgi:MFS transporter, FSR family, fosmidomycin resistance protein